MKIFIYTLSHPLTGEVRYVGQTSNPKKRYSGHINRKDHTKKSCWIMSLKNKNLLPVMDIIDEVGDDWIFWEKHYISLYKSWGFRLTNLTDGGDGTYGYIQVVSEETRQKLRIANIGKKMSPEAIEKTAQANRGRKVTDEVRKVISDKLKGIKIPPDVLLKRAQAQRKAILQFDMDGNFIKEWSSSKEAIDCMRPNNHNLSSHIKIGKPKSWCGFKWKYK